MKPSLVVVVSIFVSSYSASVAGQGYKLNALEDNAWLGGSVTFAERNLEQARVNFQTAVKIVYNIEDEKTIKPVMEYEEYDVGEKPDALNKLKK